MYISIIVTREESYRLESSVRRNLFGSDVTWSSDFQCHQSGRKLKIKYRISQSHRSLASYLCKIQYNGNYFIHGFGR